MPKSAMFARLAITLYALSFLLFISLHFLKADYDIRTYMVSHYAIGKYGWVMTLSFLIWSAGLASLTTSLLLSEPSPWHRKIGAAFLFVASAGLIVSAMYKTELPGMPDTPDGHVHDMSFLVNVFSILIAVPLISFGLRSPVWKIFRPAAITLSILVVLAFVLQFLTLHKGMPYGITNRIFVITLYAWGATLAVRLKSLPTDIKQIVRREA